MDLDIQRLADIERADVIGTSGSGKSTFGRKLAESLQLPYFEMDQLYWQPNWQEPTDEEFFPLVQQVTEQARWVLDGNYMHVAAIKWKRVQLIIWLDMPLWRTLFRVTTRCIKRSLAQQEIWQGTGNRETLRKAFLSRDSVILWALTSYRRNKQRYSEMMHAPEMSHIWFVRLTNPKECDEFLAKARQATELR